MSFPLNPTNNQQAIVNGIKYNYNLATNSWRRDFNNVLDRLYLVGTNEAVNTSTGDLVVYGGGVFRKSLIVGGNLTVSGSVLFQSTVTGVISTATTAINFAGGAQGSLVYQTNTSTSAFIGIQGTGTILMSNGVIPIWTSTAAITSAYAITATNVLGGGLWEIPFQTGTNITSFSPNFTYNTNTLSVGNATSSTSPSTGALVVAGGVGIGENLFVAGNFQVNGTTTFINSTNLDVTDKNITLSKGAINAPSSDMAGITVEGPATQPTILYRSLTDSWNLNKLLIGTSAQFTNSTVASSTNSGALQVVGGIGVGGTVFANGLNGPLTGTVGAGLKNTGAFTSVEIIDTTQAITTNTGALKVGGGLGVGRDIFAGGSITSGDIKVTSGTTSTSIYTGALTVSGGAGIIKDLWVGGTINGTSTNALLANISINALNASTSTNIIGGAANRIPYQSSTGITTFSPFLNFTGTYLETIRLNLTTSTNLILPNAYYGLDLQNLGNNQSPAIRLAGSSSGFAIVSSFGTLRIMQDSNTLTNSLMNISLTSVTLPVITSSVSTQTGSLVVAGGVGVGGSINVGEQLNVLANAVVAGSVTSANSIQTISTLTNASGVVSHNFALTEVFYHSNMAGNFVANFVNFPTTENREYTIRLVLNQGGTGYYATGVQINGASQTLRWSTAPTAGTNKVDVQSIRIMRVSGAWIVMSTLTSFT